MDEIKIYGLECYAYHGVYEEEKRHGQRFVLNATLFQDVTKAGKTDAMLDSTHYGEVCQFMSGWMRENGRNLLEAVACQMAEAVLQKFPLVWAIELEIQKPDAPIPLPFDTVSVKVKRSWHKVYLSVGSNMGEKERFIQDAVLALCESNRIRKVKQSELLITKPYGGVEQDDFVNGAVALETTMQPEELLDYLYEIEQAAGRERKIHWGPRTLDLDIVFYDDLVLETEDLILPHVDMQNRYFVLKPLSELCPNKRHPLLHMTVTQMLAQVLDDSNKDQ